MHSGDNQQQVVLGQNLISIRQFQIALGEKVPRFEEDYIPEGWDRSQVDLNCSEYLQKSRKEIIDEVIDKIINEEQELIQSKTAFSADQNTLRARAESAPQERQSKLRSYAKFKSRPDKEVKMTKSKKQINYIASMMKQSTKGDQERAISPGEVIITVSLFHPGKQLKQQEFQVLGTQCLTALRDRLYCLADYLFDGQQCKSGFFFIENTFYNDMRFDNNTDYSKNFIDWVNEKRRFTIPGVGICNSRKMEETTFLDLSIKIGQPYLYVHQGNCEHNIVFTDVRMISPSTDVMNYNAYPRHVFQAKIRRRKCRICDIFPARYVTYNDRFATEDPFFYCEHCYRPLHYDFQGRILYNDFEVYPYYHE